MAGSQADGKRPNEQRAGTTPANDTACRLSDDSLAQIATQWSLLRLAHDLQTTSADAARQALLLRYGRAVRRFVGVVVKDPIAADDVAQDVMVRLMRGDFAGADANRGRFRDLLKHAIRNMVRNYWSRENRRTGVEFDEQQFGPVDDTQSDAWEQQWTSTLLENTWRSLEEFQRKTPGSLAYSVLRMRTDEPDADSEQLAALVSRAVNKKLNAAACRQQLRRARLRFAQLMVEEVARGLPDPAPDAVEEELISLGVMEYVRDFLPDDWRTVGQLRAEEE
ncbi:sigma-70 family RNA polymerase sigma factor [Anatilimnocola floriformis]|uniref:sigma-70 family RNA polymerase sigma factor n=1 Tax=Anatilimnocola floriformis TaxID=2948575 RepID=UPI0020C2611B|nr:sigma-70 family RNA polymerase sigma factor [Anatilimnocola floriformis]